MVIAGNGPILGGMGMAAPGSGGFGMGMGMGLHAPGLKLGNEQLFLAWHHMLLAHGRTHAHTAAALRDPNGPTAF